MKKFTVCVFFCFFVACGGSGDSDLAELIATQSLEISELNNRLVQSYYKNSQLSSEISELETALAERPAAKQPGSRQFWFGTEDDVRENFLEFFHGEEFQAELLQSLGETVSVSNRCEIHIGPYYLKFQISDWRRILFLFSYEVAPVTHEITWTYAGYDIPWWHTGFTTPRPPATPRQLTTAQDVTVRFYHFPESRPYEYTEETIRGEDLWAETIRLSVEHMYLSVRDWWYEGTTLYADLMLSVNFNLRIGLGSIIWAQYFIQTFYTFPNVQQVKFLFDGNNFTYIYNDWCLNTQTFWWWDYD